MSSRRIAVATALVVLAGAIVWWIRPDAAGPARDQPGSAPAASPASPPAAAPLERSTLADGLNATGGTIQQDIHILATVLEHWATNFPAQGNPVGTNAEITRALTGTNRLHLSLIPPDHPAIDRNGELIDRWGTPFRFHQWSGAVTEIISAGPDRDFATADDVSSQ